MRLRRDFPVRETTDILRYLILLGILRVGDVLKPVDDFAVEFFLDGDVGHGGGGGGAMPVLFVGGETDDVTGANFFDGAAVALCAAATCGHDERLA